MREPSADQLTVSQRAGHRTTSTAPGAVTLLTKMLCLPSIDATYAMLRPSGDQNRLRLSVSFRCERSEFEARRLCRPPRPCIHGEGCESARDGDKQRRQPSKRFARRCSTATGAAAVPPVTFLSANARSDADWKRSVGWLFRQRWTIVRRLAGMDSDEWRRIGAQDRAHHIGRRRSLERTRP